MASGTSFEVWHKAFALKKSWQDLPMA